jgi:hypothetical protein
MSVRQYGDGLAEFAGALQYAENRPKIASNLRMAVA